MTYMDDVERENEEYRQRIASEKGIFAKDAASWGNDTVARVIEEDDSNGLVTTLSICIHSCGFVEPCEADGGFACRKASSAQVYERWNWRDVSLSSDEDLIAAEAVGQIDPKYLAVTLCTPPLLPAPDRYIFRQHMNVVYDASDKIIMSSASPVSHCFAESATLPKWARVQALGNSLRALAKATVLAEDIFVIHWKYVFGMRDQLEIDRNAVIEGLMRDSGVGASYGGWLGFGTPHKPPTRWQAQAISNIGLAIDDDKEIRDAVNIVEIWTRLCKRAGIVAKIAPTELKDGDVIRRKLKKLGDVIGVDDYIDAYMRSRLSVDDLVHVPVD